MAKNKKTTAQLIDEAEALIARLMESEGVTDDDLDAALEKLSEDIKGKADAWAYVIRAAKSEVEFYKKEIASLTARKRARERLIERAKFAGLSLLETHEAASGETKIKTERATVYLSERDSLEIADVQGFAHSNRHREFIVYEPKIDRRTVKELIQNGEEIPGAVLAKSRSVTFR